MAALGCHFAITDEQLATLEAVEGAYDRFDHIAEEIEEEAFDGPFVVETEKAWDGIQRCLAAVPKEVRDWELGAKGPPQAWAIGGARVIEPAETGHIIVVNTPAQVSEIAAAIAPLDRTWFDGAYAAHCLDVEPEYDEENGKEYIWEYFLSMRDWYRAMAGNGRHVIFNANL